MRRYLLIGAVLLSATTAVTQQPNIVLILADDLGYGDLGCYGQKLIQTPNIDRIAAEGLRFTQAYAGSTVCAPSRCALMTGMHNGHNRIRDNIPHGVFLKDEDVTMAEVLKAAGYRTGAGGKWSLGVHGSEGKPNDQGFDDWFGYLDQDHAHIYYPQDLWDNDTVRLLPGNRGEKRGEYSHDLFTDRAMQFIRASASGPVFLYLAYTIPHYSDFAQDTPEYYIVPDDAPYTDRDWPQRTKNYAAMITRLDRDVGRIRALLRELGIEDNTLVLFTSDNGPLGMAPELFDSNGPLRGFKRDLYEGGIRVPFLACWPGQIPAGGNSAAVFAFWDLLPTLADLAGVAAPGDIDGRSVLDALLGRQPQTPERPLYWDYGHTRGNYMQAVRLGDWKAVRPGSNKPVELYDLAKDPSEANDAAALHPEVLGDLIKVLDQAAAPSPDYPVKTP